MDLSMPDMTGLDAIHSILRLHPEANILCSAAAIFRRRGRKFSIWALRYLLPNLLRSRRYSGYSGVTQITLCMPNIFRSQILTSDHDDAGVLPTARSDLHTHISFLYRNSKTFIGKKNSFRLSMVSCSSFAHYYALLMDLHEGQQELRRLIDYWWFMKHHFFASLTILTVCSIMYFQRC
jgi:hypothetical protein